MIASVPGIHAVINLIYFLVDYNRSSEWQAVISYYCSITPFSASRNEWGIVCLFRLGTICRYYTPCRFYAIPVNYRCNGDLLIRYSNHSLYARDSVEAPNQRNGEGYEACPSIKLSDFGPLR